MVVFIKLQLHRRLLVKLQLTHQTHIYFLTCVNNLKYHVYNANARFVYLSVCFAQLGCSAECEGLEGSAG